MLHRYSILFSKVIDKKGKNEESKHIGQNVFLHIYCGSLGYFPKEKNKYGIIERKEKKIYLPV